MSEQFLYEQLDAVSKMGFLKRDIPEAISVNLNPKFAIRPYQTEAFARFIHCHKNDYPNKELPLYLMFNMATGSGKTLIMAGLILHLYEQGYRNFLFFVNSTNIIRKTKENFLNPASSKYLFASDIIIGHRHVQIEAVENFEGVNPNNINISFTTIQQLHVDLTTEKENSITLEDFRKHKVVLIADEAHHLNSKTKGEIELLESWESTVEGILNLNQENMLLEFTATHDYADTSMVDKYRNKVLMRYDLKQFRNDKYSKDVMILQSDFALQDRILQALVLNLYKQEIAAKHRINLKPVVLFKAQKTIAQSLENKANFHKLIAELKVRNITKIRRSDVPVIKKAFVYFTANGVSDAQLVARLKQIFHADYCLSVNDEGEKETLQILLNSLEDSKNKIRAIFAVQKLNEGWDVLNLFDIVRCYESRDGNSKKIGKTTVSEAQLIGRGARYFPFVVPGGEEVSDMEVRYKRKYDEDLENELRVLEELHYHSINEPRYIHEIRTALAEQGAMDGEVIEKQLALKPDFKATETYKAGVIYTNVPVEKNYAKIASLNDLGVKQRNHTHTIATGHGGASAMLSEGKTNDTVPKQPGVDLEISKIDTNIVIAALDRCPFFRFSSLKRYFKKLKSIEEFVSSKAYLAGFGITFMGDTTGLEENREELLLGVLGLLKRIETEASKQITDYEGSREFRSSYIHDVFTERLLKFSKGNSLVAADPEMDALIADRDWYVFDGLFGTSEEKAFVKMLDRQMKDLRKKYDSCFLVRNKGHFKIYNFADGRAFEPDFVLFLREKDGHHLTYQIFIEPKGKHLKEHDKWKAEFLAEIRSEFSDKILELDGGLEYRLVGVPFYNNAEENVFKETLLTALGPK